MDLSIILVNWNSTDYLRECVASIYEFTSGVSFEVIVVDNASRVQDCDRLVEQFSELKVIKSSRNLGFARANNLGFRQSSGDHVLFLNPDTRLLGQTINIVLERLKSLPDAGVIGCKLLNSDLSVQTSCIQSFPTVLNQLMDVAYLRSRWPNSRLWGISPLLSDCPSASEVEAVSGACMMLRREVFAEVGMFSEEYFMYAEDLDLCYKVVRAGYVNYYISQARMIHHGGKSSRQQKIDQWATIMKVRAVQHFCVKTRGRGYGAVYRAAMACSAMGRLLLIGLASCIVSARWNSEDLSMAAAKWKAILRWALGLEKAAFDVA